MPEDVEDGGSYITATALRRVEKATQKKVMRAWFYENYRNPIDCCPYDSGEGGYQFLWGGPYEPEEELHGEFNGFVHSEALEELAAELWDVAAEWTGPDRPEDVDDYIFESVTVSLGPQNEFQRSVSDIRKLLETDVDGPHRQCLLRLLYANVVTALEAYLADFFISAITDQPDLKRKFVKTTPDFEKQKISFSEIFEAWEDVENILKKHLAEIAWHNLARIKPMFRDTLEITFPDDIGGLFSAVLVRHDLVHRNGKTKDGGEHAIKLEDVKALVKMAESLVDYVESRWLKVNPKIEI